MTSLEFDPKTPVKHMSDYKQACSESSIEEDSSQESIKEIMTAIGRKPRDRRFR